LQPVFSTVGVNPALVWLAEVESSFNPSARSPVGARGLFQFMPATAQELGLSIFMPDERTDPKKSADAAARMLRQLHRKFRDWPLAIAAYNAGPGRVQRTLDKHKAKTFAEIASALPVETRLYVPKVLATLQVREGVGLADLAPPRI
jgi:membrane-bound lytic murein transglycosylase D